MHELLTYSPWMVTVQDRSPRNGCLQVPLTAIELTLPTKVYSHTERGQQRRTYSVDRKKLERYTEIKMSLNRLQKKIQSYY